MNGFGFIEYEDMMDARDVVPGQSPLRHPRVPLADCFCSFPYVLPPPRQPRCPGFLPLSADGSELKGERLTVQFARGPRRKDDFGPQDRQAPRPRRTIYRMQITGLQSDTSWQVSMQRKPGLGQCMLTTSRISKTLPAAPVNWMWSIQRLGATMAKGSSADHETEDKEADRRSFVEFETGADLKTAVSKLDGQEFKGAVVHCVADVSRARCTRMNRVLTPTGPG